VRNEVLKVVLMKVHVFWDIKPRQIGKQLPTLQRSLLLPSFEYMQTKIPNMEASGSSKMTQLH
jgi:hypothetical protein